MPRKHSKTKRRTRRRGAGIRDWIKKAHHVIRSKKGYSRGLAYAYDRWGRAQVGKHVKNPEYAGLVDRGVRAGLAKLRQSGYGLRRSGNGLRRSGNGLRRSGMGEASRKLFRKYKKVYC